LTKKTKTAFRYGPSLLEITPRVSVRKPASPSPSFAQISLHLKAFLAAKSGRLQRILQRSLQRIRVQRG
jgi:hypothetical protein